MATVIPAWTRPSLNQLVHNGPAYTTGTITRDPQPTVTDDGWGELRLSVTALDGSPGYITDRLLIVAPDMDAWHGLKLAKLIIEGLAEIESDADTWEHWDQSTEEQAESLGYMEVWHWRAPLHFGANVRVDEAHRVWADIHGEGYPIFDGGSTSLVEAVEFCIATVRDYIARGEQVDLSTDGYITYDGNGKWSSTPGVDLNTLRTPCGE